MVVLTEERVDAHSGRSHRVDSHRGVRAVVGVQRVWGWRSLVGVVVVLQGGPRVAQPGRGLGRTEDRVVGGAVLELDRGDVEAVALSALSGAPVWCHLREHVTQVVRNVRRNGNGSGVRRHVTGSGTRPVRIHPRESRLEVERTESVLRPSGCGRGKQRVEGHVCRVSTLVLQGVGVGERARGVEQVPGDVGRTVSRRRQVP